MFIYLGAPNYLLIAATALCILLGIVHSVLGEVLIFRHWRKTPPNIPRQHQGIIIATWHITTLLAFTTAILIHIISDKFATIPVWHWSLVTCFILSGLLVLWLTKARHPGWIVLFIIAGLVALA